MRAERFLFGAPAVATDGTPGKVSGLVVGQHGHGVAAGADGVVGYSLRYLVVEPWGRVAMGRLVPMGLAHPGTRAVRVNCDAAAFERLPAAEASRLVPGVEVTHGYAGSWFSAVGMAANDIVPTGHVTLHAAAPVRSAGRRASLAGLVVDRDDDDRLVDLVVNAGRPWRRRSLTVPVEALMSR